MPVRAGQLCNRHLKSQMSGAMLMQIKYLRLRPPLFAGLCWIYVDVHIGSVRTCR